MKGPHLKQVAHIPLGNILSYSKCAKGQLAGETTACDVHLHDNAPIYSMDTTAQALSANAASFLFAGGAVSPSSDTSTTAE